MNAFSERALRETHEVGLVEAMNYLLDCNENETISDAAGQPKVEGADQQAEVEPPAQNEERLRDAVYGDFAGMDHMESTSVVQLIEDDESSTAKNGPVTTQQVPGSGEEQSSYKCLMLVLFVVFSNTYQNYGMVSELWNYAIVR